MILRLVARFCPSTLRLALELAAAHRPDSARLIWATYSDALSLYSCAILPVAFCRAAISLPRVTSVQSVLLHQSGGFIRIARGSDGQLPRLLFLGILIAKRRPADLSSASADKASWHHATAVCAITYISTADASSMSMLPRSPDIHHLSFCFTL